MIQGEGKKTPARGNVTDHNAAVVATRQAGPDQARHKVCRGRAVVPADAGGKGSHGGVVEVQRAAVRGVRIQRTQSCLPNLRKKGGHGH